MIIKVSYHSLNNKFSFHIESTAISVLILSTVIVIIKGQHQPNHPRHLSICSQHTLLKGNGKIQDPSNNKRYFICINDLLILKYCQNYQVFDPNLSECITPEQNIREKLTETKLFIRTHSADNPKLLDNEIPVPDEYKNFKITSSDFKCPNNNTANYPQEDDCRRYYHCENGELSNATCPRYFLFDINTNECQFFALASCYEAPKTVSPPICTEFNEDIPIPQDCKHYYHCHNGERTIEKCGFFRKFDKNKRKCRFFLFASCDNSKTNNFNIKYSETTNLQISDKYTKDNSLSENNIKNNESRFDKEENYQCPRTGVHDDIFPNSCHKYYHCEDGSLTIKKCSFFHNFDPIRKKCRWFFLVCCHARPVIISTTESPIITSPSTTASTIDTTSVSTIKVSTTTEYPSLSTSESPTEVTSELTSQSAISSTSELTTESLTESSTESPSEPTLKSTSESSTAPTSELTTESPTEETSELTSESDTASTSEWTSETPTELTSESTSESSTELTTETPTGVTSELTSESESTTESPTEETSELTSESESTTESPTEETSESTSESSTELSSELTTETPTEVTTELTSESDTASISELTSESSTESTSELTTESPTEPSTVSTTISTVHTTKTTHRRTTKHRHITTQKKKTTVHPHGKTTTQKKKTTTHPHHKTTTRKKKTTTSHHHKTTTDGKKITNTTTLFFKIYNKLINFDIL